MNYWLLLADPKSYSFHDLMNDKKTVWDGIAGSLAQKHLRSCKRDDIALIYHTALDKAVVGAARITSDPYQDPKDPEKKLVVVELQPLNRLEQPVPLSALRENKKLSGLAFLKIQRIAVSPMTKSDYDEIVQMGKGLQG